MRQFFTVLGITVDLVERLFVVVVGRKGGRKGMEVLESELWLCWDDVAASVVGRDERWYRGQGKHRDQERYSE